MSSGARNFKTISLESCKVRSSTFVLGLDVSTTTVGITLTDGVVVCLDYVSLKNLDDVYEKSDLVAKKLREILESCHISGIFIEEDLQKMRAGMSSAATIQKLTRFNGIVSLLTYQIFGIKPQHINVNLARKSIGCKIDRNDKTLSTKEKVFRWTSVFLESHSWPTKILKSGEHKGEVRALDECFDMADSFVIAMAGQKIQEDEARRTSRNS